MDIIKWIVVVSSILNFGFMTFDGARGIIVGDYVRPASGQFKGQLGPWVKVVKFAGIDPESTFMKMTFLLWGLIGLAITVCFVMNLHWAWKGMLIMNIGSLWYLIPGTVLSVVQIILLLTMKLMK
jgi:hypothetical protein